MQAVSISFFRFEGVAARLWAFGQMQFARAPLRRLADIGFFKLFGTGTGEGFTPVPNFGVYAILATWPSLAVARRTVATADVFQRYRRHAAEHFTIYLTAVSSRGQWDGRPPFSVEAQDPVPATIAVLTRATVKKRFLYSFWSQTPDISSTIREQTHLRFKMGMGEVPWLQQVTFSVWDDAEAMKAFAYRSQSHGEAVRRVRQNGWFEEELYARFRVLAAEGTWGGLAPLASCLTEPEAAGAAPVAA